MHGIDKDESIVEYPSKAVGKHARRNQVRVLRKSDKKHTALLLKCDTQYAHIHVLRYFTNSSYIDFLKADRNFIQYEPL